MSKESITEIIRKRYFNEIENNKEDMIFLIEGKDEMIEKERKERVENIVGGCMCFCEEENCYFEFIEYCLCDKLKLMEIAEYHLLNCIFYSTNQRIKQYCRIEYLNKNNERDEFITFLNKHFNFIETQKDESILKCEKYLELKIIERIRNDKDLLNKINSKGWNNLLKHFKDDCFENIVELWMGSKDNCVQNVDLMKERMRKIKRNERNAIIKDYIKNEENFGENKDEMLKKIVKRKGNWLGDRKSECFIDVMKGTINEFTIKEYSISREEMVVVKEKQRNREDIWNIISQRGTIYLNYIVTKEEWEMMEIKYKNVSDALKVMSLNKSLIDKSTKELYEISEYIQNETEMMEEIIEENSYNFEDKIRLADALGQHILSYDVSMMINQNNTIRKDSIQKEINIIGTKIKNLFQIPSVDYTIIQHCLYGMKYQLCKDKKRNNLEIFLMIEQVIHKRYFAEEMIILLAILMKVISNENIIEIISLRGKERNEREVNVIIKSIYSYNEHFKKRCLYELNQISDESNYLLLLKFLILKEIIGECKDDRGDVRDGLMYMEHLKDEYSKRSDRNENCEEIMNIIYYNEAMKNVELVGSVERTKTPKKSVINEYGFIEHGNDINEKINGTMIVSNHFQIINQSLVEDIRREEKQLMKEYDVSILINILLRYQGIKIEEEKRSELTLFQKERMMRELLRIIQKNNNKQNQWKAVYRIHEICGCLPIQVCN